MVGFGERAELIKSWLVEKPGNWSVCRCAEIFFPEKLSEEAHEEVSMEFNPHRYNEQAWPELIQSWKAWELISMPGFWKQEERCHLFLVLKTFPKNSFRSRSKKHVVTLLSCACIIISVGGHHQIYSWFNFWRKKSVNLLCITTLLFVF